MSDTWDFCNSISTVYEAVTLLSDVVDAHVHEEDMPPECD